MNKYVHDMIIVVHDMILVHKFIKNLLKILVHDMINLLYYKKKGV